MINKVEILRELLDDYKRDLEEIKATGNVKAIEMIEGSIKNIEDILSKESSKFEPEKIYEESVEVQGLKVGEYKDLKQVFIASGLLDPEAPTPKGNTKKKLEKILSSICKWRKATKGRTIIVDEVYKEQLIIEDKRRDKAIYVNPIKTILFYSLRDFKGELYFSVNKFIEILELFNRKYYDLQHEGDYIETSKNTGISVYNLKGFKIGSKREAQRIISRALSSMKSQKIIDYVEGRIVVIKDGEVRLATVNERRKIQRIEQEELERLGCFNMAYLKFKNIEDKFFGRIKERFKQEGLEYIDYTFHGYSIVSHDKTIAEQIELIEKESNVSKLKELFKKRLEEFAESNHKREIKKENENVGFGEPMLELNQIASNSYIPDFKKAIETFI